MGSHELLKTHSADGYDYALLVLVVGAILVVLLFLLESILKAWRDGQPMSFEQAFAPGRPPMTFWAGRWYLVKKAFHRFHYAITGTTRSGKSLLLMLFVRSILRYITPGSNQRLVLFDPKNELHPALVADAKVPLHFLLPSDERGSRWDISRDLKCPAAVVEFCKAAVPDAPGDRDDFFRMALREIMAGVIDSLDVTNPGAWDLADLVRILETREYIEQVLGRTYGTRSKLRFMNEERTWGGIEATIETSLNALRILAAMWSRTGQKTFSLTEFVEGEAILVLGRDPNYAELLDPINIVILTQLFGLLLSQSDSTSRRTYVVIDELTVAAGENRPLPGLKDVCERGASRGVVVVAAYQSYADVKALYKESGDAVLGMLQNQIFLRAGDTATAEFASKAFGKIRKWIKVKSVTTSSSGGTSRAKSEHYHEEDVIPYERLLELPPATPEDGITGYWLSPPPMRSATPFHLSGDWVAENLPERNPDIEPYMKRPDHHQYLEPFRFKDLKRLGLTPPEEEHEAKVVRLEGGASPSRDRSAKLPAPRTPDRDPSGKLRRIIGCNQDRSH